MSLVLCVVTIFFIPTARHVIEGRAVVGMVWIFSKVSSGNLLPFLLWMEPEELWNLFSIIQHETILPSSWFRNLKIPSIPPTASVDVSFCKWCREYTTLGLTRLSHNCLLVLHHVTNKIARMINDVDHSLNLKRLNKKMISGN